MFIGVNPLSNIQSISIDRQRTVFHCVGDEDGNELLRELIGTVIVGTSRHEARKPIRFEIAEYPKVRARFACGVGAARIDRRFFTESAIGTEAAVDLISGNLDEF